MPRRRSIIDAAKGQPATPINSRSTWSTQKVWCRSIGQLLRDEASTLKSGRRMLARPVRLNGLRCANAQRKRQAD
jgi:hypothetical protein